MTAGPGGVPGVGRVPQRYEGDVDVSRLTEHPENPRRGDVEAIDESMEANGFYGAIYAQESTGRICAGNHRYRVAVARGAQTVPVIWLDVDDDQARRILAVDQRTAQLGGIDTEALARLLGELEVTDAGLAGSGYSPDYLESLGVLMDESAWDDMDADRAPAPGPTGSGGNSAGGPTGGGPPPALPRVALTVPPDLFEGWRRLLARYDGPTDTAKLIAHLRHQGLLT